MSAFTKLLYPSTRLLRWERLSSLIMFTQCQQEAEKQRLECTIWSQSLWSWPLLHTAETKCWSQFWTKSHICCKMRNELIKKLFSVLYICYSESESHQSCLFATPWTIVHGILQARILEWVAFPFSRGPSQRRAQTQVSHIVGGFFCSWATREAQECWSG